MTAIPEDVRERARGVLTGRRLAFDNEAGLAALIEAIAAFALSEREAAQREERMRAETVMAQAYQVIGNLLDRLGEFDSLEGIRALDYFSGDEVSEDFLPWPARGQSLHDSDYQPRAAAILQEPKE